MRRLIGCELGSAYAIRPETAEPGETRVQRTPESHIDVANIQASITKRDLVDRGIIPIEQCVLVSDWIARNQIARRTCGRIKRAAGIHAIEEVAAKWRIVQFVDRGLEYLLHIAVIQVCIAIITRIEPPERRTIPYNILALVRGNDLYRIDWASSQRPIGGGRDEEGGSRPAYTVGRCRWATDADLVGLTRRRRGRYLEGIAAQNHFATTFVKGCVVSLGELD